LELFVSNIEGVEITSFATEWPTATQRGVNFSDNLKLDNKLGDAAERKTPSQSYLCYLYLTGSGDVLNHMTDFTALEQSPDNAVRSVDIRRSSI
jgi:hypothetical protein